LQKFPLKLGAQRGKGGNIRRRSAIHSTQETSS
jgi:hypothetical protein